MGQVVVSGAFGALGQGVVELLAERGHRVVALGRGRAPVGSMKADVLDGVELTDDSQVAAAFGKIAQDHGPITGLVNVAGGFAWEPQALSSPDNWECMYRTNLLTAALSCRHVLPHLAPEGASIVNIGAAGARAPVMGMAPYAASKAGVMALTQSLADELKPSVRVNAVLPTIIDTPANRRDMPEADYGQWVTVSSLAKVIAFLLSPDAAAVTGEGIAVSLGMA